MIQNSKISPEEFFKWLSETIEFNPNLKALDEKQTKMVKDKLAQIFTKETPNLAAPKVDNNQSYCVNLYKGNDYNPMDCINFETINVTC